MRADVRPTLRGGAERPLFPRFRSASPWAIFSSPCGRKLPDQNSFAKTATTKANPAVGVKMLDSQCFHENLRWEPSCLRALLDHAALAFFDEGGEDGGIFALHGLDFFESLGGIEPGGKQVAEGFLQCLQALG